jgi:hypothetical protein
MECRIVEKYLKGSDCTHAVLPAGITKHLGECKDCQKYYQFSLILNSQNCLLEKAPADILPFIENRILDSIRQSRNVESLSWFRFKYLLKPSLAGFIVLLAFVLSYTYLTNKNIGCVENLSKRFKIAQFENIKSGDMLYAGDNTTVTIRLKSKNKLQIHQNTIVRVNSSRQISLSRGEISLMSGDKELQIETPDGLLRARNTNAKVHTIAKLEKGLLITETTCIVLNGELIIKSPLKETFLNQGQKVVLAENGRITYQTQLTTAESESESEKDNSVQQKLFAAVESLCDCITAAEYTRAKKGNHVQLFGKEVNESKFKVRVFWQEKGLNGLAFGSSAEKTIKYSPQIWRSDG